MEIHLPSLQSDSIQINQLPQHQKPKGSQVALYGQAQEGNIQSKFQYSSIKMDDQQEQYKLSQRIIMLIDKQKQSNLLALIFILENYENQLQVINKWIQNISEGKLCKILLSFNYDGELIFNESIIKMLGQATTYGIQFEPYLSIAKPQQSNFQTISYSEFIQTINHLVTKAFKLCLIHPNKLTIFTNHQEQIQQILNNKYRIVTKIVQKQKNIILAYNQNIKKYQHSKVFIISLKLIPSSKRQQHEGQYKEIQKAFRLMNNVGKRRFSAILHNQIDLFLQIFQLDKNQMEQLLSLILSSQLVDGYQIMVHSKNNKNKNNNFRQIDIKIDIENGLQQLLRIYSQDYKKIFFKKQKKLFKNEQLAQKYFIYRQGRTQSLMDLRQTEKDGHTYYDNNQKQMKQWKQTVKLIKENDLMAIKSEWDQKVNSKLQNMEREWPSIEIYYFDILQTFFKIMDYRSYQLEDYFNKIYPNYGKYYKFFSKQLCIEPIQRQLKKKRLDDIAKQLGLRDWLFDSIAKTLVLKKLKEGESIKPGGGESIKLKVNFSQLNMDSFNGMELNFQDILAKMDTIYSQTSKYQNFITILCHNSEIHGFISKNKQEKQKIVVKRTRKLNFFKELQIQRIFSIKCLGCTRFLYYRFNLLQNSITRQNVKIFAKVTKMKDQANKIKEQICSMMNSNGGIILFDCELDKRDIIVSGQVITENMKEEIQQRLYSYLDVFYPKIQINHNVIVNFIPIMASPITNDKTKIIIQQKNVERQNQFYYRRPYFEGLYVTRVIVKPTDGTKMYFWKQEESILYHCSEIKFNKSVQVKMKSFYKRIKRNFKAYYLSDRLGDFEKQLLNNFVTVFDHKCEIPEAGVILKVKEELISDKDKRNYETQFKFMSLLICKNENIEKIQNSLQKLKIKCHIQIKFSSYKFKPAHNTSILYHDAKFQEILTLFEYNQQFKAYNKNLFILSITNYLKLMNRHQSRKLTQTDITTIKQWLLKQFPNQKLKLYEHTSPTQNNKEYYIETQTKKSILFLYYFLNHHGQKVYFKNPTLSNYSLQQRKKYFKQVYPPDENYNQRHQNELIQLQSTYNIKIQSFLQTHMKQNFKLIFPTFKQTLTQFIQQNQLKNRLLKISQLIYQLINYKNNPQAYKCHFFSQLFQNKLLYSHLIFKMFKNLQIKNNLGYKIVQLWEYQKEEIFKNQQVDQHDQSSILWYFKGKQQEQTTEVVMPIHHNQSQGIGMQTSIQLKFAQFKRLIIHHIQQLNYKLKYNQQIQNINQDHLKKIKNFMNKLSILNLMQSYGLKANNNKINLFIQQTYHHLINIMKQVYNQKILADFIQQLFINGQLNNQKYVIRTLIDEIQQIIDQIVQKRQNDVQFYVEKIKILRKNVVIIIYYARIKDNQAVQGILTRIIEDLQEKLKYGNIHKCLTDLSGILYDQDDKLQTKLTIWADKLNMVTTYCEKFNKNKTSTQNIQKFMLLKRSIYECIFPQNKISNKKQKKLLYQCISEIMQLNKDEALNQEAEAKFLLVQYEKNIKNQFEEWQNIIQLKDQQLGMDQCLQYYSKLIKYNDLSELSDKYKGYYEKCCNKILKWIQSYYNSNQNFNLSLQSTQSHDLILNNEKKFIHLYECLNKVCKALKFEDYYKIKQIQQKMMMTKGWSDYIYRILSVIKSYTSQSYHSSQIIQQNQQMLKKYNKQSSMFKIIQLFLKYYKDQVQYYMKQIYEINRKEIIMKIKIQFNTTYDLLQYFADLFSQQIISFQHKKHHKSQYKQLHKKLQNRIQQSIYCLELTKNQILIQKQLIHLKQLNSNNYVGMESLFDIFRQKIKKIYQFYEKLKKQKDKFHQQLQWKFQNNFQRQYVKIKENQSVQIKQKQNHLQKFHIQQNRTLRQKIQETIQLQISPETYIQDFHSQNLIVIQIKQLLMSFSDLELFEVNLLKHQVNARLIKIQQGLDQLQKEQQNCLSKSNTIFYNYFKIILDNFVQKSIKQLQQFHKQRQSINTRILIQILSADRLMEHYQIRQTLENIKITLSQTIKKQLNRIQQIIIYKNNIKNIIINNNGFDEELVIINNKTIIQQLYFIVEVKQYLKSLELLMVIFKQNDYYQKQPIQNAEIQIISRYIKLIEVIVDLNPLKQKDFRQHRLLKHHSLKDSQIPQLFVLYTQIIKQVGMSLKQGQCSIHVLIVQISKLYQKTMQSSKEKKITKIISLILLLNMYTSTSNYFNSTQVENVRQNFERKMSNSAIELLLLLHYTQRHHQGNLIFRQNLLYSDSTLFNLLLYLSFMHEEVHLHSQSPTFKAKIQLQWGKLKRFFGIKSKLKVYTYYQIINRISQQQSDQFHQFLWLLAQDQNCSSVERIKKGLSISSYKRQLKLKKKVPLVIQDVNIFINKCINNKVEQTYFCFFNANPLLDLFISMKKDLSASQAHKIIERSQEYLSYQLEHPVFHRIFKIKLKDMMNDFQNVDNNYFIDNNKLMFKNWQGNCDPSIKYGFKQYFLSQQINKLKIYSKKQERIQIKTGSFTYLSILDYYQNLFGFYDVQLDQTLYNISSIDFKWVKTTIQTSHTPSIKVEAKSYNEILALLSPYSQDKNVSQIILTFSQPNQIKSLLQSSYFTKNIKSNCIVLHESEIININQQKLKQLLKKIIIILQSSLKYLFKFQKLFDIQKIINIVNNYSNCLLISYTTQENKLYYQINKYQVNKLKQQRYRYVLNYYNQKYYNTKRFHDQQHSSLRQIQSFLMVNNKNSQDSQIKLVVAIDGRDSHDFVDIKYAILRVFQACNSHPLMKKLKLSISVKLLLMIYDQTNNNYIINASPYQDNMERLMSFMVNYYKNEKINKNLKMKSQLTNYILNVLKNQSNIIIIKSKNNNKQPQLINQQKQFQSKLNILQLELSKQQFLQQKEYNQYQIFMKKIIAKYKQ